MKKIVLTSLALAFILSGCYSKCGFTESYYCSCEEWYDAEGRYHKKCPDEYIRINIGAKIDKPTE